MTDKNDFTMTRRTCLFGMLLAPFAKALSVEPRRGTEFILQSEGFEWVIRLKDGRVEEVLFNGHGMFSLVSNRRFVTDRSGWSTFTYHSEQQSSKITLRVVGANVEIHSFYAAEIPYEVITGRLDAMGDLLGNTY